MTQRKLYYSCLTGFWIIFLIFLQCKIWVKFCSKSLFFMHLIIESFKIFDLRISLFKRFQPVSNDLLISNQKPFEPLPEFGKRNIYRWKLEARSSVAFWRIENEKWKKEPFKKSIATLYHALPSSTSVSEISLQR